jgi:squalene monooxygenase
LRDRVTADVVVAGGGFTGAFAAAALADGRRRIVVLDARPGGGHHLGGDLIHAAGVDILVSLGLWPILADAAGERIDGFSVTADADDTPVLLPYGGVPAARLGGVAIDHQEILSRVHAHLAACPGVEVHTGEKVVDVVRANGRVTGVRTSRGVDVVAGLTLIADGRHSRLRKAIGIRARQRPVSLSVMLLCPNAALPQRNYARVCLGAPGPILLYPMRGGGVRFCVDVPAEVAPKRERLPYLLRSNYAPALPEPLRSALLSALESSPLILGGNHTVYTDRCTVPGAAVLGDAASCSHPLTASGMTNALADIRILSEEMRGQADVDRVLARYALRHYRFARVREILADELYQTLRAHGAASHAIRAGLFRYWRTSAHGRAATVALLSGDDARVSTFLAEYLGVVRESIHGIVAGQAGGGSLPARARSLAGLARDSLQLLNRVGGVYTGSVR